MLRRLARPIEFAARDQYAHVQAVKDLGPSVCRQIGEALAQGPYALQVEVSLLALRVLFEDFERVADAEARKALLERARHLLRQLRGPRPAEPIRPLPSVDGTTLPAAPPAGADRRPLWEQPVQYVKGVGPKRAQLLARLGIVTVEDFLWAIPWRYEDRTRVTRIRQLAPGTTAMICGVVRRTKLKQVPRRRLSILEVVVEDAGGQALAVFFNQPYLAEQFVPGTRLLLQGRVTLGARGWIEPRMEVDEHEVLDDRGGVTLHLGRIAPVYHETRGWTSRHMRALAAHVVPASLGAVEEVLPSPLRQKLKLPLLSEAVQALHAPGTAPPVEELNRAATPAHARLAFEELFLLEVALANRHEQVARAAKPFHIDPAPGMFHRLRGLLPFQLTMAQMRVIDEIAHDMTSPHPMNRLVQGDVGSGKTVVALHALALACASGQQAAVMVPTEILAEQHFLNLAPLCERLGLAAVLLAGRERGAVKRARLAQIEEGTAQVVIGTHAVLQQSVAFARLGLVVIDEQHKFGVVQRKMLVDKGYQPDVLILTATPIPRTLAMTVYGDLDVSVIDSLPPGRKPIHTVAFPAHQRGKGYRLALDELQAGRQVYVVYPLVEESEKVDLEAAEAAAERLQRGEFAGYRVGLVHGRLKPAERHRVMEAFKAGGVHVLVATTVIEVGVDVPNATVMIVEHAERFGLAQLHQLRGRVGRGAQQSYCVLVDAASGGGGAWARGPEGPSPAQRRLDAMLRTTDGFAIAEEDLNIRGPGEVFGTRQSGLPEFRAANLIRDAALVEVARKEAYALLRDDPDLVRSEHQSLKAAMRRRWQQRLSLGDVS